MQVSIIEVLVVIGCYFSTASFWEKVREQDGFAKWCCCIATMVLSIGFLSFFSGLILSDLIGIRGRSLGMAIIAIIYVILLIKETTYTEIVWPGLEEARNIVERVCISLQKSFNRGRGHS